MNGLLRTSFVFPCLILISNVVWAQIQMEQMKKDEGLFSLVISQSGETIFREFYNDNTPENLFCIYSVTKSLTALLTGIAIDKGFIRSVDQPVSDFFPELLESDDPAKRRITIRHLLNHTSGLQDYEWPNSAVWSNSSNPTRLVLSQPLVSDPGKTFRYNTAAMHVLSGVITIATERAIKDFAGEYLLNPLGITEYQWSKMNDGFPDGGGVSVWMRADDLVKIGNMLLNKGKYNQQQIVSESWINTLFNMDKKSNMTWGLEGSRYGFGWYGTKYKEHDIFYAMGYAGQFLYVIPEIQTVIVVIHNHQNYDGNTQSAEFMKHYFPLIYDAVAGVR